MNEVQKTGECMMWQSPQPYDRRMGLMFERDITPTRNLAAGTVIMAPGEEQPKLSVHEGAEEVYFVVRGTGQFVLGESTVDMEPGTAVYVGPGVGHRAINSGDVEMELFWVNTPPVFGPVGAYNDFLKTWERVR